MLHNEDATAVKSAVNMRMLAQAYGIAVNANGFALCPFHADRNPSMKVYDGYLTKDGYHCYACGAGGDIIRFVMDYEGVGFEPAVRRIAGMFAVPIADAAEITDADRKRIDDRRRRAESERRKTAAGKAALDALAGEIRRCEDIMETLRPLSGPWCALANRLPRLEGEWEEQFEALRKSSTGNNQE